MTRTEHTSREWVPLHFLADQTTDKNGRTLHREWVILQMFEQIITTDENGWIHIQVVSCTPLFEQIRTIYKNDWTCLQDVICSLMFEHIRMTDKNDWICTQRVSYSPVFVQIWTSYKNGQTHSKWVALQCLHRSVPLTRMVYICSECDLILLPDSQCKIWLTWTFLRLMLWQSF